MKKPKQIEIIASNPIDLQTDIDHLIGRTFNVVGFNWETLEVGIKEKETDRQQILINKNEYRIVE